MAEILTAHGHEVAFFSTRNPKNKPTPWSKYFVYAPDFNDPNSSLLEKIKITFRLFYNFEAKRNLQKLINDFKPDIAHLHNIYHHISPSITGVLQKNKIPMVMTLHDYKLISPNYNLYLRGKIWEASKPDKYWRCFTDRCLKDSYAKSFIAAAESYLHQWMRLYDKINLFISPSHFLINKFKEFGFKREIVYLPNPFLLPEKVSVASADKYIFYYGRLSAEKGIEDLLRAYGKLKSEVALRSRPVLSLPKEDCNGACIKLKIAGSGPLEDELKRIITAEKITGVEFVGYQTGDTLWQLVAGAEAIVVPSRWYENAPYTIIEAMGLGKIVLATRLGGATELIDDGKNGFLFTAGDIDGLSEKLKYILSHPELKNAIGDAAIASVKSKNDPEKFYQVLFGIYQQLVK
jgi:glycosyltransferase involved in cell wall biosynthesis